MLALISISAKGQDFPQKEDIIKALTDAGVTMGLDERVLADILRNREKVLERVIASGRNPDPGIEDQLTWHVNISERSRPTINTDGKADFKRLNQFEAVKAGDKLLTIVPGREAQNGYTVRGRILEAPVQREPLVATGGKNTRLSKDGLTLFANIDGAATLKGGEVMVDNVLRINGDVSFSTGNINYRGTVIIEGDVRSGFRVEATESIHIRGSVEAAEIYSKNGSIFISNGVLGRHRAKLLAGADLQCGFLQDASASVKNNVIIAHHAINSNITSGGQIILLENEGLIRGGKTVAEQGIELLEAGSEKNILTEMVLTRSDMGEDHTRLWQAKIRLAEEFQHLDSLKKREEFLTLLQQRLGKLSEEREAELKVLGTEITATTEQVDKIRREAEELEEGNGTPGSEQAVRIHKQLHNQVTVRIGHKKYFSTDIKGGVSIYRKGDDLRVEPMTKVIGKGNG